jgi:ADP-ribosylglycohydrolase
MKKNRIALDVYQDKVLAGWLGKSIGGVIGARLENQKFYHDLTVDRLWPDEIGPNDDLDIQVVWLEALQERGLYLKSKDLAEFWQDRCWYNFCEYGYFLNNVERGIAPPVSGVWNNTFFWESEGCPIRSEIWAMVCPGNPSLAAEFAKEDAQLDHGGVSVEIEQFLAAAAAHAFICDDLEEVLATGFSVIPTDSPAVKAYHRVKEICQQYPDPAKAWRLIIREFGDRDASKAITNHAIVLMALFLGKMDFRQTMLICANSGWDTDCTAATAGALLGIMFGTKIMPDDWRKNLGKNLICGIEVKHKTALLSDFTQDTVNVGLEMAKARNHTIEIVGSPEITVRPAPEQAVSITASYPEEPVLWNSRKTPVKLIVNNPFSQTKSGQLRIDAPAGLHCEMKSISSLPPGNTEISIDIFRQNPGSFLADKNLFNAQWIEQGHVTSQQTTFGLGGARQWQVYGPYWSAWDKIRNPICPYYNDKKIAHPGQVGYGEDSYSQYARLDEIYLDEARLIREDLPEEVPMILERGEDILTEKHLGGFKGQACYYLVRTIQSDKPIEATVMFGYTGPFRVWVDGKENIAVNDSFAWSPATKWSFMTLTGKPQRLVIKLIRPSDFLSFSITLAENWKERPSRGVSWYLTNLSDQPPVS